MHTPQRDNMNQSTLPVKPKFSGSSSVDSSINFMCTGAGVQVVARVPSAGPVPPPTNVVMPTSVLNTRKTKSISL